MRSWGLHRVEDPVGYQKLAIPSDSEAPGWHLEEGSVTIEPGPGALRRGLTPFLVGIREEWTWLTRTKQDPGRGSCRASAVEKGQELDTVHTQLSTAL